MPTPAQPGFDPRLRAELLAMQRADFALRTELAATRALFDGYAAAMAELHARHAARLRTILAEHGWPGHSLVGDDGAEAAWLVLQHAIGDPAVVRSALPLLERAVARDEAPARHLAYLVDRIRTLEGRAQRYGTQHDWDANGALNPLPIEDPAHVDQRRDEMGLDSLAAHTRRLREQAAAEGECAPDDPAGRLSAADEWARSVGWRGHHDTDDVT